MAHISVNCLAAAGVVGGSYSRGGFFLFIAMNGIGAAAARTTMVYGVDLQVIKKSGLAGGLSLLFGIGVSFIAGALVTVAFGYTDAESLATVGAGVATYIVGPVTGTAVGASTEVRSPWRQA